MSRQRSGHAGKSETERQEYIATQVRGHGPTIEDEPIIDTTDRTAKEQLAHKETRPARKELRPKRRSETRLWGLTLDQILLRILGFGICVVIVGLVVWNAKEVYTLNRELGELKVDIQNIKNELDRKRQP